LITRNSILPHSDGGVSLKQRRKALVVIPSNTNTHVGRKLIQDFSAVYRYTTFCLVSTGLPPEHPTYLSIPQFIRQHLAQEYASLGAARHDVACTGTRTVKNSPYGIREELWRETTRTRTDGKFFNSILFSSRFKEQEG